MSFLIHIKRLLFVDYLIEKKATGSPVTLSKKCGISRASTLKMLFEMKEIGYPIAYDKKATSYYYGASMKHLKLNISLERAKLLSREELKKVMSGDVIDASELCFSPDTIFVKC